MDTNAKKKRRARAKPALGSIGFTIRLNPEERKIIEAIAEAGGHKSLPAALKAAALANPLADLRHEIAAMRSAHEEAIASQRAQIASLVAIANKTREDSIDTQVQLGQSLRELASAVHALCSLQTQAEDSQTARPH